MTFYILTIIVGLLLASQHKVAALAVVSVFCSLVAIALQSTIINALFAAALAGVLIQAGYFLVLMIEATLQKNTEIQSQELMRCNQSGLQNSANTYEAFLMTHLPTLSSFFMRKNSVR